MTNMTEWSVERDVHTTESESFLGEIVIVVLRMDREKSMLRERILYDWENILGKIYFV